MDTWYYAKRCFTSLVETLAKHMIILKDQTMNEIIDFLNQADQYGKAIKTAITIGDADDTKNNVSYEARLLKRMFLKLRN